MKFRASICMCVTICVMCVYVCTCVTSDHLKSTELGIRVKPLCVVFTKPTNHSCKHQTEHVTYLLVSPKRSHALQSTAAQHPEFEFVAINAKRQRFPESKITRFCSVVTIRHSRYTAQSGAADPRILCSLVWNQNFFQSIREKHPWKDL